MFFSISKLFWLICAPSHLAIILVIAAAITLLLRKERPARGLAVAAASLFVIFGMLPTGVWMMHGIENQYPRPAWPSHVDGILVLGGGLDEHTLRSRGVIDQNSSVARLIGAYEAARRYPQARVLFTGGSAYEGTISEAAVARHVFLQMGLAPERLILEAKSRNTWENFTFSKAIAKPRPGEVWLLATSAFHMPRAMAIARRVGWTVIPWPTDYWTAKDNHYDAREWLTNLNRSDMAIHEWIGIVAYRWTGKAAR
jgi:uncharacterized SAM-binding protein YcdF (DUF218 family)